MSVEVINLHNEHITVKEMQEELRVNPLRLEEKMLVDVYDRCTPLTAAAYFGNVAVVEYLLSAGANIEATNQVSCA